MNDQQEGIRNKVDLVCLKVIIPGLVHILDKYAGIVPTYRL